MGVGAICDLCRSAFQPYHHDQQRSSASVTRQVSLFRYEDRAAQAVRRLKYSRATALVLPMANLMRQGFECSAFGRIDAIVPVPIHTSRRMMRGFNQSELLCEEMPEELAAPLLLRRVRATKPQARLNSTERSRNLVGAFRASPLAAGKSILLVDDVTTTGHTAEQCAIALLEAGADSVSLLTFAGDR
jgi:ComF family protein